MFLGHDSGVSHLPRAHGAPCVLLSGPPILGDVGAADAARARHQARETMDAIPVDAVRAEIRLIARR